MKLSKYHRFSPLISHAYVMLTEACPLDCEYCYIRDRTIDNEVSMADIDTLVSRFSIETPQLVFFGGEPLLKLELIREVVEKYKDRCRFQIVTSGLVNWERALDTAIIPYKEHFDLQVSWDGPNATTRKLRSGAIRGDRVYDAVCKAAERGISVELRSVINDESVKHLRETVQAFRDLNRKYPHVNGDLTIAHQPVFKPNFHIDLHNQLCAVYDDLVEDIRERGCRATLPRSILGYVGKAIGNQVGSSCDAGTHVVMRPDGMLYPCTILSQKCSVDFCMGHVSGGNLDWDRQTTLRSPGRPQQCRECRHSRYCDGGCRYERVASAGEKWADCILEQTCLNMDAIVDSARYLTSRLSDDALDSLMLMIAQVAIWSTAYETGNRQMADRVNTRRIFAIHPEVQHG